jgi:hypothetical protein
MCKSRYANAYKLAQLWLLVNAVDGLSDYAARSTDGLIFQYDFNDRQTAMLQGRAEPAGAQGNPASPNPLGNITLIDAKWLPDSIGLQVTRTGPEGVAAETQLRGPELNAFVDPAGNYTFELWYRHDSENPITPGRERPLPIMVMLRNSPIDCQGFGFEVLYALGSFNVDALGESQCYGEQYGFNAGDLGQVHHAAFTVQTSTNSSPGYVREVWSDGQRYYSNNEIRLDPPLDIVPTRSWPDAPLTIGRKLISLEDVWEGGIFMMALYNRTLDNEELFSNYQAFLANSAPVTRNIVHSAEEDSTSAIAFQFGTSDGAAFWDFDVDQKQRWEEAYSPYLWQGWLGYHVWDVFTITIFPPDAGFLVYNGTVVSQELALAPGDDTVYFSPAPDEFGAFYTTIHFRVHDGQYSSEISAVTVHVSPANDAPMANPSSATAFAGVPCLLALSGTDPDEPTGQTEGVPSQFIDVTRAWVDTTPQHGELFQVLDPTTPDTMGIRLAAGDEVQFWEAGQAYVWFVSYDLGGSGQERVADTFFNFSLGNDAASNARSSPAPFVVAISNYMDISNFRPIYFNRTSMVEDATARLWLNGVNRQRQRDIRWTLLSPPSGVLVELDTDQDSPLRGTLLFRPEDDFNGDIIFSYFCEDTLNPSHRSPTVHHAISVSPKNDPVRITITLSTHNITLGGSGSMAILLSNAEGQSDIVLVTLYCPESTLLLAQAPDQAETPYQLLDAGKAQSTIVIQDYLDRLNLALSNITITAFGSPGTEQCFITAQDRMTPTLRNAMPDSLDTTERWQIHKHTSAPRGGRDNETAMADAGQHSPTAIPHLMGCLSATLLLLRFN